MIEHIYIHTCNWSIISDYNNNHALIIIKVKFKIIIIYYLFILKFTLIDAVINNKFNIIKKN